jgi:hypothetical protein
MCELCIPQDLAQEAPSDVSARVNRHGNDSPICMSHPHVTSFLPDDLKARFLQSPDDFLGPQSR